MDKCWVLRISCSEYCPVMCSRNCRTSCLAGLDPFSPLNCQEHTDKPKPSVSTISNHLRPLKLLSYFGPGSLQCYKGCTVNVSLLLCFFHALPTRATAGLRLHLSWYAKVRSCQRSCLGHAPPFPHLFIICHPSLFFSSLATRPLVQGPAASRPQPCSWLAALGVFNCKKFHRS